MGGGIRTDNATCQFLITSDNILCELLTHQDSSNVPHAVTPVLYTIYKSDENSIGSLFFLTIF